jgi:hypothetical protein
VEQSLSDEPENTISQRRIGGGPLFRFGDDHLTYCGVEWDFKIRYENIVSPSHYRRSKTPDRFVTAALLYLLVLNLVILWRDHEPQYGPEAWYMVVRWFGGLVGAIIVICGSLYFAMHREYTVIATTSGNILVIRDKLHDAVIERLRICRLKRLRKLSAPDLANSLKEELAKLKWLQDEGAITHDEYAELCARVKTNAPAGRPT